MRIEKGLQNAKKPRNGCFEIREEGEEGENGEKFIHLLDMNIPFTTMKALDINEVFFDILDKISLHHRLTKRNEIWDDLEKLGLIFN